MGFTDLFYAIRWQNPQKLNFNQGLRC